MFDHVCIPSSCFNAVSLRYGCCSDYMMVMLNDITGWLKQQDIPYFITYGTLLGTQKRSLDWFGISLGTKLNCAKVLWERKTFYHGLRPIASIFLITLSVSTHVSESNLGGHGHCGGSFILAKTPARFGGEALTISAWKDVLVCTIDRLISIAKILSGD